MNTQSARSNRLGFSTLSLALVCLGTVAGLTLSAPVQARERQASVTGGNANTATRDVSRAQGDVTSTTTGPQGKSASRKVNRSAGSASSEVAGPKGNTASRETEKTSTGSQTTVTGPKGQTNTVSVTR